MGRIGRRWTALLVVASMAGGTLAAPSATAGRAYRTFPTCLVLERSPSPDHSCAEGDAYGAVFVAKHKAHIHYRLCFRPPHGAKHCVRKKTGHEGKPSKVGLFTSGGTHAIGTWRLKWKHGGHIVDRDRLHVGSEGV
jgi:hypothetical protein